VDSYRHNMRLLAIAIASLALAVSAFSAEEPITITASSSKQEMLIGDTLRYTVTVEWQKGIELKKVEPGATIGIFEIQDVQTPEEKPLKGDRFKKSYTYVLSTFDTGEFEIPPFTIEYATPSGEVKTAQSQPIKITVKQVPRTSTDRNDIRDIKPPLSIPANTQLRNLLLGALAILLVLGTVGGILVRKWLISRRAAAAEEWIPPKPIEELAYDDLNALAQSNLLEQGKIMKYHIHLSEIMRIYLGRRYRLPAIDMTTYELMYRLEEFIADEFTVKTIQELFDHCDMVKFAKYVPERAQCTAKLDQAKMIVDQTTPRPLVVTEAQQEGAPHNHVASNESGKPEKEVTV
jgi:hypothetical protein